VEELCDALTASRDGTVISLEVSAGSKTERFPAGYNPWRKSIGCLVRAPAVEGKANAAVIRLLASFFSLPQEKVQILSGATSSQKRILLAGMHPDQVQKILESAPSRGR
jgi:uncharacterized protein (TIGR00251 family)